MRILVADDDPTLRLMVTSGMRALRHDVVECESGTEAWERFKAETFPLVITDWMMPGLDGLELTQHIRKAARESYTYVIMLTAKGTREDYFQGLQAGADAFLIKPLDPAMLEAQVHIASRILGLEAHAKRLEAIMTVCSYCKKVKDQGTWVSLSDYVASVFKIRPSHGYCPTCYEEVIVPELKQLGLPPEGLEYP